MVCFTIVMQMIHRYTSSVSQPNAVHFKSKVIACISGIAGWMKSNRLKLNPSKSEFVWCATTRRLHLVDMTPFHLDDGDVTEALSIRNLGAYFDVHIDMTTHIKRLDRASFYQLRRIRTIRRSIPTSTAIRLVNSFVVSKVDYCNSLLAGLPAYQLEKVQSILNYAAPLIYGRRHYDHVTPLLPDGLHWLRVPQRVRYKSCLLLYKAMNGLSPSYIHQLLSQCIQCSRPIYAALCGSQPTCHSKVENQAW